MKLSYEWLSKYLDLSNIEPKDLAEKIERTAVEVDSVQRLDYKLKKIVVGHTLEVVDHPDSDHLHICQIDVGEEEPIQIVCGAPNIQAGQDVIVALHGSRIKDNVKIKRSKMRGVPSNGMVCALQEIGYPDSVVPAKFLDGIYVFPADSHVKPGDSVMEVLKMNDDIIDTDITPNRGDMFSIMGNVYELGAILNQKPDFSAKIKIDAHQSDESVKDLIKNVSVSEADAPVYKLMAIKNVSVKPSPFWLQVLLMKAGIRPVNNVIDAVNLMMYKYGQALQVFDLDKINAKDITVENAKNGEKLTLDNDTELELRDSDLVVKADGNIIELAGVATNPAYHVINDTKNILLEVAVFNPIKVRKTARHFNVHTETAMRLERGVDYSSIYTSLKDTAQLISTFSNGEILADEVIGQNVTKTVKKIDITLARINKVLGTSLKANDVIEIFNRLAFNIDYHEDTDTFTIEAPLRRWDISIQADLLEEIARIYGYDNLPTTLPNSAPTIGQLTPKQKLMRATRSVLEGLGLTQAMSYGLTTIEKSQLFVQGQHDIIKVDWPMTKDHEALRMSLISGLLDDIAYNKAHYVNDVALYEQGRIFYSKGKDVQPEEIEHVAGAITGSFQAKDWQQKAKPVNFFDLKGIVEQYLTNMALKGKVEFVRASNIEGMHPTRTAQILLDGQNLGFIGQIHPQTAKEFKINDTYVFELNLSDIIAAPKKLQHYDVISKYPAVTRDIAILVNKEVSNTDVLSVINDAKQKHLVNIELFDVYNGKNLEPNMKSMAYQLTYQDSKDTLQESVVNEEFAKVVKQLEEKLDAKIR